MTGMASGAPPTPKRAFISYASQDAASAARLCDELSLAPGLQPWLDKRELVAGSPWEPAIRRAILGADIFILLLSSSSTTKRGFIQKEIRLALDVVNELPEEDVFVIPVRIEECDPHFNDLKRIQYVDLFPDWDAGVRQIRKALRVHLGIPEERGVDRSRVDRSPFAKSWSERQRPGTFETSVTLELAGSCAAGYGGGAVIGDESGRIHLLDDAARVVRSRVIAGDGAALTAVTALRDGGFVVGTKSGQILKVAGWDDDASLLRELPRQVRGLLESSGRLLATCGINRVAVVEVDGRGVDIECELNLFGIASGCTPDQVVVAGVRDGEGGLIHVQGHRQTFESLSPVSSRALARHPNRSLYVIGVPISGMKLISYETIPPRMGAVATGTYLSTESVEIHEERAGEAFDPYMNATNCSAAQFSPGGSFVAGGHDAGQVALWDTSNGFEVANIDTGGPVVDLVFLRGGELLAVTPKGVLVLSLTPSGLDLRD